jgi:hypothetical protein
MKSVDVTGDKRAAGQLRGMGARAANQTVVMQQAGRAAQRSVTGVPVDTGRLQRSVHGGPEAGVFAYPDGYVVVTRVPYARHVFHGTRYMPARPPQLPRGQLARDAALRITQDVVQ